MSAFNRFFMRTSGVLALVAVLGVGCKRSSSVLAELESREGTVERDFSAKIGAWEPAPVKAKFEVGDAVRTGNHSTAHLQLSDRSVLSLDDHTLIRFLAKPPGANSQGLDVQSGRAELEVAGEALSLDTGHGMARIQPGTRLRLTKTEAGTRFAVLIGSAQLDGAPAELHAGDSLEIGIGRATIEPASKALEPPKVAADLPSQPVLPTNAEPEAMLPRPDAGNTPTQALSETRSHGPEIIDIAAGAGESLIIHDPRPPTAIGFSTAACAGMAVIQIGQSHKNETVGTGSVHASFPAGTSRYRAFCVGEDKPFAQGTVSILHDSGSRALASSAPATRLDTDGRRYTVLYQNLLPKMSVRWPGAPSGPYTLTVRSSRTVHRVSSAQPNYSFAAGAFGEGSYDVWFEAPGARSKDTTVVIQFDNAAPTASITAPADGSFAQGASVAIAGSALPGWTVSVAGLELEQDAQHRFSGHGQASPGTRALAIRFANPQRGVQYYLRRSSN